MNNLVFIKKESKETETILVREKKKANIIRKKESKYNKKERKKKKVGWLAGFMAYQPLSVI